MKRINILRLRDTNRVGGPEKTILDTALAIDSARFSFTLASFVDKRNRSNDFLESAMALKIQTLPLEVRGKGNISAIFKLAKYIRKNQIDIVHTHDYKSRFVGYWAARFTKVPAVTTLHGWIKNTKKEAIYVAIDRIMLRFYSRIIAVSKNLQKETLRLGIPSERVILLYNAVPEPPIIQESPTYYRQRLGFNNHQKLIGCIGRLSKEKGVDDLLLAVPAILEKFPDERFLIIGEGPEGPLLQARTKELGLESYVSFPGFRDDMNMIYPALDLVVLPSYTEGLPKVLLEALSYGKPVVATEVGGVPEIIIPDRTGILVPPGSPILLAQAICELLGDCFKAESLGEAGKAMIFSDFNTRSRTQKLEHLYEAVVAGESKRR